MLANYHTHTVRCHHAFGSEREYIETAIKSGKKVLGFSDHSPQFFESGYVSPMRMTPDVAEEYVAAIKKLAEEYKNDIKIYVGFEAEYFPAIFKKLQKFCREFDVDYLILGQHYIENEDKGIYVGSRTNSKYVLSQYVDEVINGIETGSFSYIAHPDVCNFCGDEAFYKSEMTRLCNAAKKNDIPLEINMLGLDGGRHYPSSRFFKIAAAIGNKTVIGCDAHTPEMLNNKKLYERALDFAKVLNLDVQDYVDLKRI